MMRVEGVRRSEEAGIEEKFLKTFADVCYVNECGFSLSDWGLSPETTAANAKEFARPVS